ncbi:unnamed protein product [Clonostachys rosea f. rosea IK726]|uniref:Signal recognition particle subunit SRP68 n=2 Tax=Bionectria ochroleuca TaxID=29856 RepID=A0A0B7JLJ5_BIOOC|nr:unnamed protein product [Clonostachys rosea f. rosea IK726]
MEITSFIIQGRDKALLDGDYSTYQSQLARRLLKSRQKLGIATRNRGKFSNKAKITSEDIAQNNGYIYLALLTSEHAWAQAMSMKASHTNDQKGLVRSTRKHIVSRLRKAVQIADNLVEALSETGSVNDLLEVKGYAAMMHGTINFEKKAWEPCLESFSTVRVIYSALGAKAQDDIYKDLTSEIIDPSIRFAAYRLNIPRTAAIPEISKKKFPTSDEALVADINKINPKALEDEVETEKGVPEVGGAPRTLTWRSREVTIEDSQISTAWGAVQSAKSVLAETYEELDQSNPGEVAAAYDKILTATQDAVDATKTAIDELRGEGVSQGDPRMQSLQITRTAVNYEMISWRIGRNRVLTGPHDGATEEYNLSKHRRRTQLKDQSAADGSRELPSSGKLAKLKEKAALYDGTLQNLQTIRELPGVAADVGLATKLDVSVRYFQALTSLAVARSHAIIGNVSNALALIQHALDLSQDAAGEGAGSADSDGSAPLHVDLSNDDITFLIELLTGELQRHRAIVHIENLRKENSKDSPTAPLIERLHEYPSGGINLASIVEFPPKKAAIPVKPIFLDVAWNYIEYPGKATQAAAATPAQAAPAPNKPAEPQPAKKGWFGFGRS